MLHITTHFSYIINTNIVEAPLPLTQNPRRYRDYTMPFEYLTWSYPSLENAFTNPKDPIYLLLLPLSEPLDPADAW